MATLYISYLHIRCFLFLVTRKGCWNLKYCHSPVNYPYFRAIRVNVMAADDLLIAKLLVPWGHLQLARWKYKILVVHIVVVVAFYWHITSLVRLTSHIQHKNTYIIKATHKLQDTHSFITAVQICPGRGIFKKIWTIMWAQEYAFKATGII